LREWEVAARDAVKVALGNLGLHDGPQWLMGINCVKRTRAL
jgi:hypothetical protein